jgi:hypothetical protein
MSTFIPQSHAHHFVSPAHSRTHSFDLARSSPPESQTRQHEATPPNSVSPPGHGQLQQHGQHLVHQHHQGFALGQSFSAIPFQPPAAWGWSYLSKLVPAGPGAGIKGKAVERGGSGPQRPGQSSGHSEPLETSQDTFSAYPSDEGANKAPGSALCFRLGLASSRGHESFQTLRHTSY